MTVLMALAAASGLLFVIDNTRGREPERRDYLAARINGLLPQTQCRECGYSGCRPYAEAIAAGNADIYGCPPGGAHTINLLAELLGTAPVYVENGTERDSPHVIAKIDEALCIGCVKCINACPVDAIIGAAGQMHTVMPKVCTGCRLCIAPCPVDCIAMLPEETRIKRFVWTKPRPLAVRTST